MASLLARFRRPHQAEDAEPSPPPRLPLPPPGRLRRERRALLRYREQRIHHLGGLVLEMVREDAFRQDIVLEHAVQLIGLEERLRELDGLLAVAVSRRQRTLACANCGTPLYPGARFCPSCGRPVAASPAP
jgi:hypothetical protein